MQPLQPRLLSWRPKGSENSISLVIYSDLTEQQLDAIVHFARTEKWPLTAEGLFLRLKEQKRESNLDNHLVETFALTPEFWTVELLFNRSGNRVTKQEILTILLDGDWTILKHFIEQQRQLQDTSEARRQKFLLDYVNTGSASAAMLLIKSDREFSVKKLDDQQIVALLKIIPPTFPEGVQFSKELLISPRSSNVWRQASRWLYANVGESMPEDWTYRAAIARFVPEKANIAHVSKPSDAISSPSSVSSVIPLVRSTPLTGAFK